MNEISLDEFYRIAKVKFTDDRQSKIKRKIMCGIYEQKKMLCYSLEMYGGKSPL